MVVQNHSEEKGNHEKTNRFVDKKALSYRVKISYNSKFSDLNSKNFGLIISAVGSSPIKLSVPGLENVFQLTGHEYFWFSSFLCG